MGHEKIFCRYLVICEIIDDVIKTSWMSPSTIKTKYGWFPSCTNQGYIKEIPQGPSIIFVSTWSDFHTHPLSNNIDVMIQEVAVLVEVLLLEEASLYDLIRDLSLQIHEVFQHLIVGLPAEHDLSCGQFVDGASCRPHVDAIVVWDSEDDLWGSVEPWDQIGRDVVVSHVTCSPEVAEF